MDKKFVAIDMSKAYLLARMTYEARKVLHDDWLNGDRRAKTATLYEAVGNDFNNFFINLKEITKIELHMLAPEAVKDYVSEIEGTWYRSCVHALEVMRDNLDEIWHYAYSGKLGVIKWLTK